MLKKTFLAFHRINQLVLYSRFIVLATFISVWMSSPLLAEKGDSNIEQICLEQMGGEIQVNCRTRVNIISVSSGSFDYVSISTAVISSGTIPSFAVTGTLTNDNAPAGRIGQFLSSSAGYTSYPATGVWGDLTSISLTPGDWDVSCLLDAAANGGNITTQTMGIGATSGNNGPPAEATAYMLGPTITTDMSQAVPAFRVSISATASYYLKYRATYTVATPLGYGRISARRVR